MFRLRHHHEGVIIVTVSKAFQDQLDRLTTGLSNLNSTVSSLQSTLANAPGDTGPAVDAEDTAALSSALDASGLPVVAAASSTAEAPPAAETIIGVTHNEDGTPIVAA